jgi:hypothetical protein
MLERHGKFIERSKADVNQKNADAKSINTSFEKKDVRKGLQCYSCGGPHYQSSCPNKGSEEKNKTVQTNVEGKKDAQRECKVFEIKDYNKDDLVYVSGSTKRDRSINILLDTGASHSFIDKSLVDFKGDKEKKSEVVTATGKAFSLGTVEEILEIEGKEYRTELQVIFPLSEQIILGRDFMDRYGVQIDFYNERVTIRDEEVSTGKIRKGISLKTLIVKEDDCIVEPRKNVCEESQIIVEEYWRGISEKGDGCTNTFGIEHKIDLLPNRTISNIRNYNMDLNQKDLIIQTCLEMSKLGVIEESTSRWNAPILMVGKRTGGTRMCIDYRGLNDRTVKEVCQPPTVEECLNVLSGAQWFSQIDLEKGYHQVPMAKESRELTAFMSPIGKFQYRMMPFGLTNAPATFQRLMYKVFRSFINVKVVVYMDDITVYSKTHEDHHNDVREVLKVLVDNGLRISKEKSVFCTKRVDLLGFSVIEGKVMPDDKRLGPFKEPLDIQTIKQLHSFIGCVGYFRNFIKDFAKKTFELNAVINRKMSFEEANVEDKVEQIRKELVDSAWLALPDMDQPFIIEADASDYCIGGVLKQKRGKQEVAIRFYSRNMIQAERNYSTLEKELLAVINAVRVFKNYLHKKFTIRTDHKSLIWLYKVKNPQGRIARWIMFLSDLDFVIEYKEGDSNLVADCLSRLQLKLIKKEDTGDEELIKEAHCLTGHSCARNTYSFLKKQWCEVKIKEDEVKKVVENCETCIKFKRNSKFKIYPTKIDGSFMEVGIDCIGPLPRSNSGNRFIVLVTDYFTKWVEGKALKQKSAKEIARFLVEEVFARHGTVKVIRSDQGLEFTNMLVHTVAEMWGSRFRHSSPYHPQSNGLAERTNRTVIEKMSKAMSEYKQNWDKLLPYVLMQYRVGIIEKYNASPFMMLYGRKPQVPKDLLELPTDFELYFEDPIDYCKSKETKIQEIHERMDEVNEKKIERTEKENERRKDPEDLELGDKVLVLKHNSLKRKFESPYVEGHFEIVGVKGQGAYQVKHVEHDRVMDINRKDLVKVSETERVLLCLRKGRMLTADRLN